MEYKKASLSDIGILTDMRINMLCEESPLTDGQKRLIAEKTMEFLFNGLSDNSVVSWVAANAGDIVGMGCVNFFSFPPNDWCPIGKTAYIGNMYTLPGFRGQGIALTILTYLVDEVKSRQCQRILLNATDMGRPLYEKCGFEDSPTAMALYPFGIIPPI